MAKHDSPIQNPTVPREVRCIGVKRAIDKEGEYTALVCTVCGAHMDTVQSLVSTVCRERDRRKLVFGRRKHEAPIT